jgi:hypothetical protein
MWKLPEPLDIACIFIWVAESNPPVSRTAQRKGDETR